MQIHPADPRILFALLISLFCIPSVPHCAPDSHSIIPVYQLLLTNPTAQQQIFIIGASTVRYDNNLPGDVNTNTGLSQYPTRIGWGSALFQYMRYPANVSNQGRRGATSISYRDQPPPPDDPDYKGPAWWGATQAMIEASNTSHGGYLFIQFGANDLYAGISENDFKTYLRFYRDAAFTLGLTPVFITPVDSRAAGNNRGSYPRYMIELAAEPLPALYQDRRVVLLDLHQRSLDRFGNNSTVNLDYRFGNVPYIWLTDGIVDDTPHNAGDFNRMDTTHFEERGAIRVAGWLRDLACELADQSLCQLFKRDIGQPPPTVYFTGEYLDDPNDVEINGWYIADAGGNIVSTDMENTAIIHMIPDDQADGKVISFDTYLDENSPFLEHGFHTGDDTRSWANQDQHIIAWDSLFTSDDFRIYVEVSTTDGIRHFTYKPLDIDQGPGDTMPQYLRFGLGTDATDGNWHSYEHDLEAELQRYEPENTILQVNGIRIKGTGRIDNLRMF